MQQAYIRTEELILKGYKCVVGAFQSDFRFPQYNMFFNAFFQQKPSFMDAAITTLRMIQWEET